MSRSVTVVATSSPSVHVFRNFGEDVYRAVRDECRIDLAQVDGAHAQFSVHDIPPKNKGDILRKIRKIARRHSIDLEIRDEKGG